MTSGGRTVRPFGDAALVLEVSDPREARALASVVRRLALAGVREVVGGVRTVLVTVEPGRVDLGELAAALGDLDLRSAPATETREVRIPASFGGTDSEEVCRLVGIDEDELIGLLTGSVLEVDVIGFSPGFAYLSGLPEVLRRVPRRDRPRSSVPAGSIALAGGFAAVYPQSTPGGWQLIGRTALELFDPFTPPFARLRPGDVVRFERIDGLPAWPEASGGRGRLQPPSGCPTTLVVESPGLLTTVQDGGRRGTAHLGVPGAGPADPVAHALANRLAGNPEGAAALEMTAKGPVLRCARPGYLAVVGGDPEVRIDGHPVGAGHVVPVTAGQQVTVGILRQGLRSYLAWAGGLLAPEVLGSRSTDLLTGLGPGVLAVGDELGSGRPGPSLGDHLAPDLAPWSVPASLRVLPGPHPDWFPDDPLEQLARRSFVVEGSSDRIGLRLSGDGPVSRRPGELDSQGMVTGAIQVPPDGNPVILGPDHATLGGYPVAAVVISADRWMVGQCRPGDRVSLLPVTTREAARALAALHRSIDGAVRGRYPVRPA